MKTSNIIIASTIGFVFLSTVWSIVESKNKLEDYIQHPEINEAEILNLDHFKHLVISGEADAQISIGENNSYQLVGSNQGEIIVKNDTLFISEDSKVNITCENLQSISLSGNASLRFNKFESDYLMISAFDQSKITAYNSTLNKLDLYTKKGARVIIHQFEIDTVNILATDYSRIGLTGKLEIVRGEVTGNSNLSVKGANNTQFSKKGNATIHMN